MDLVCHLLLRSSRLIFVGEFLKRFCMMRGWSVSELWTAHWLLRCLQSPLGTRFEWFAVASLPQKHRPPRQFRNRLALLHYFQTHSTAVLALQTPLSCQSRKVTEDLLSGEPFIL